MDDLFKQVEAAKKEAEEGPGDDEDDEDDETTKKSEHTKKSPEKKAEIIKAIGIDYNVCVSSPEPEKRKNYCKEHYENSDV